MPLKFRELEIIISDFGYVLHHQRGSHRVYRDAIHMITVPCHKELKPGTAKSILQDIATQQNIELATLRKRYNIKL